MAHANDPDLKRLLPAMSDAADQIDALLRDGDLQPPTRSGVRATFDRFDIVRELGEGGAGVVLLALDRTTQEFAAIKMLKSLFRSQPAAAARFRQETQLALKLSRMGLPHSVPVVWISEPPLPPCLAMAYRENGSLDQRLREGPLPEDGSIRLAQQIGQALAATHRRVIYHRDLKPENILLTDEGDAELTDFGLAFDGSAAESVATDLRQVAGTPAYLPPELARGESLGDARGDIYGLGALLYAMLTGAAPFSGDSPAEIVAKIRQGERPPRLTARNPSVSTRLASVVEKAMQPKPSLRYHDIEQMLVDLDRVARGLSPQRPETGSLSPRPNWVLAGVLLTLLLGAALFLLGPRWRAGAEQRPLTVKAPASTAPESPPTAEHSEIFPEATDFPEPTYPPFDAFRAELFAQSVAEQMALLGIDQVRIKPIEDPPAYQTGFGETMEAALHAAMAMVGITVSQDAQFFTDVNAVRYTMQQASGDWEFHEVTLRVIDVFRKRHGSFSCRWKFTRSAIPPGQIIVQVFAEPRPGKRIKKSGLLVQLNDGSSATTDEYGVAHFTGLREGEYTASVGEHRTTATITLAQDFRRISIIVPDE